MVFVWPCLWPLKADTVLPLWQMRWLRPCPGWQSSEGSSQASLRLLLLLPCAQVHPMHMLSCSCMPGVGCSKRMEAAHCSRETACWGILTNKQAHQTLCGDRYSRAPPPQGKGVTQKQGPERWPNAAQTKQMFHEGFEPETSTWTVSNLIAKTTMFSCYLGLIKCMYCIFSRYQAYFKKNHLF